ncbi:30S ribosomal protein S2 [Patescibacteria group bacterium]|nr:30S ribosomal protein S2 [Patescibacteria group bacterium]
MVKTKKNEFRIDIEKMMETGVHLGHRISKLHPKMQEFILGIRNTVHIIDLQKTAQHLTEALKFISEVLEKKGDLLLVGTKIPLKNLVKKIAQDCNLPYVTERWLGGTFTNFKIIQERVKYFKELEKKKKTGELEKYTKKERRGLEKELQDLSQKFGGIKDLEKIPEAVFICDISKDKLALREAKIKGVKVVAIVDTNADPTLVDYPIAANDDAVSSVKYILEKVAEVVKKARQK